MTMGVECVLQGMRTNPLLRWFSLSGTYTTVYLSHVKYGLSMAVWLAWMLLIIHLVALHPCRKLSIFLSQGVAMLFS